MGRKTFYYSDELNDDFSPTNGKINQRKIDGTYKYKHNNIFYKALSFFLYRCLATPIGWLYNKLKLGMRIKNRKALKQLKGGYFLYANHTQEGGDAFMPSLVSFPRANKIIVNPDAVSIPVVGAITPMLGAVPLPTGLDAARNFLAYMSDCVTEGKVVTIYPEAHIWPYYNDIRKFRDASFAYPIKLKVPTVAAVTIYRQRKIFKNLPPLSTVYVSQPIMPEEYTTRAELCEKVYNFMKETVDKYGSVGYHTYIYKEKTDNEDNCSM